MNPQVQIQHTILPSSHPDQDLIHIVIPGKELCTQAQDFVSGWYKDGTYLPPNLGSVLPYLLINLYSHKYQILISYLEPNISLSSINKLSTGKDIDFSLFPDGYFSKLRAVFLICSHFNPVRKLIYHIKSKRDQSNNAHFPLVTELQHGWLVGKSSVLHPTVKQCNPDNYLVVDEYSRQFLNWSDSNVKVENIGDVLFSSQLLHEFRSNNLEEVPSRRHSHNLLICFSERDIQIGYASKNYHLIDEIPVPEEVIPYYEYLKSQYESVNLRLRSKPHQSSNSLTDKNFPQLKTQNSIAADILWADSVVSAISTVSISSSFLNIPSFFYNSGGSKLHTVVIKQYFSKVMHLKVLRSQKDLFLKYIDRYQDWAKRDFSKRKKVSLNYARLTMNNFYNYVDSIL